MAKQTEVNTIVSEYAAAETAHTLSAMDRILFTAEKLVGVKATKPQILQAAKDVAMCDHVSMVATSAHTRLVEGVKFVKACGSAKDVISTLQAFNIDRVENGRKMVSSLQNADFAKHCGVKTEKSIERQALSIDEQAAAYAAKHEAAEVKAYALALLATVGASV